MRCDSQARSNASAIESKKIELYCIVCTTILSLKRRCDSKKLRIRYALKAEAAENELLIKIKRARRPIRTILLHDRGRQSESFTYTFNANDDAPRNRRPNRSEDGE